MDKDVTSKAADFLKSYWKSNYYGKLGEAVGPKMDTQAVGRMREFMDKNQMPPPVMGDIEAIGGAVNVVGQAIPRSDIFQRLVSKGIVKQPNFNRELADKLIRIYKSMSKSIQNTGPGGSIGL